MAYRAGEMPPTWWTSEQWAMMRWSYEQLDAETLDFIAALPHQRVIEFDRLGPVRILHGSPRSPSEHLFPDQDPEAMAVFRWAGMLPAEQEPVPLEAVLGGVAEPVVVCGHSHIPWQQALPNQLLINPGSAGAANNRDHRAQYALLTEEAGHVTVAFRQLLQLLSHPRYRTRRVLPVLPLFLPVVPRLVGAAIRDVGRVGVSRTAVARLSRTRSRATDGRGSGIGGSNG